MRPYQQTALTDARQAYRDGARRVLMVAPTGAGKTVIAATAIASAAAKGRSILVVAPRREIVAQTSAKLTAAGVRHGIIAAGQRNPWPNAPVQLGMAQTVRKRLQTPGAVANTHARRRRRSAPRRVGTHR
jgi:DNA repair protein RadD